jgi:hypothetical protein
MNSPSEFKGFRPRRDFVFHLDKFSRRNKIKKDEETAGNTNRKKWKIKTTQDERLQSVLEKFFDWD